MALTALTPERAVKYLHRRAAEVGQKTLDMERQAIQAMMVNVAMQLPPGATLPVVKSAEPHRPRPRAYSPAQVRAVAARQDPRNALATEIVHASGKRVVDRGIRYRQRYDVGGGPAFSASFSWASIEALGKSRGVHRPRYYSGRRIIPDSRRESADHGLFGPSFP